SAGYQTQGTVSLNLVANTTVILGDLADPNLEPVLALTMNQLVPEGGKTLVEDEHGYHHSEATGLTIVHDHPLGAGRSVSFNDSGRLQIPSHATFNRTDQVGFRVDFKPTGSAPATPQVFIDHEDGVQTLSYGGGKIVYRIKTD